MTLAHLAVTTAIAGASFAVGRFGLVAAQMKASAMEIARDAAAADRDRYCRLLAEEKVNAEIWRVRAETIALTGDPDGILRPAPQPIRPPLLRLVVSNNRSAS